MPKPQARITRLSFGLFVAVYGEQSPPDVEWARYLDTMRGILPEDRLLIFSWGGGPNFKQRRELEEVVAQHQGKVAVVTGSLVARGIVKAISWTGKQIRAFEFGRRDQALEFLDLDEPQATEALREARALAEEVGVANATEISP